jgi:N-acetyl-gamma-glutamyl-phosphate reductase
MLRNNPIDGSTGTVRVAVVGATGYAGAELVRLLSTHPNANITVATSEKDAGKPLGAVHRYLAPIGANLISADVDRIADSSDFAFVALPHGASTPVVGGLIDAGLRVVDLGADFRFADRVLYEQWYGTHEAPALLEQAVYGLTEYARDTVVEAQLVANPGCYPTGALMALLPIADLIGSPVFVDSKSGTSGAGRAAKTEQIFAEVTENIRPYGTWKHRHQPEIESTLQRLGGTDARVRFSPHLLPIARGLLSSCYVAFDQAVDLAALLSAKYAHERFVTVLAEGEVPELRNVRGTNQVEIGFAYDRDERCATVISAIDNLGKGAAGQAVQNFNCMLGLPENTGLELLAALP